MVFDGLYNSKFFKITMENETKSLKKTVVINVSKEENVREELVSKESISEITQENLSINEQFDVFKVI